MEHGHIVHNVSCPIPGRYFLCKVNLCREIHACHAGHRSQKQDKTSEKWDATAQRSMLPHPLLGIRNQWDWLASSHHVLTTSSFGPFSNGALLNIGCGFVPASSVSSSTYAALCFYLSTYFPRFPVCLSARETRLTHAPSLCRAIGSSLPPNNFLIGNRAAGVCARPREPLPGSLWHVSANQHSSDSCC